MALFLLGVVALSALGTAGWWGTHEYYAWKRRQRAAHLYGPDAPPRPPPDTTFVVTAEPLGRTSRSAASAHAAVTTRSRRRIVRGPTGAASPPRRLRPQVDSPPIAVEFSPASIAVARRALLLEVHSAGSTIPWQPSCDKQQWAASPAEAVDELGRGLCGVNVPIIQCAQLLDPLNIWAQQTLTGRTAALQLRAEVPGFAVGFSRPRAAHRNFYAPRKAYVF